MLEYSQIQKYDPSGMHKVYDNWPKIAKESWESEINPVNFTDVRHIVFSGMGGSGAVGDLFLSILSKTSIHITIVKGYLLPKTIDSKTLVVATSVSGNTVETISTVKSAAKLGCKIICFSSGGKLEEFCKKNNIQYRKIPICQNPRASFPAYVYGILKTLYPILPITKESISESIKEMENLSKKISSKNLTDSNPSLSLARWMSDIAVIYYPWWLQAAAIRFKNSIQENAKSHALIEDVIEACHNGIVSWERPSKIQPILIEGEDDYIKTKERWIILKKFFMKNNIDYKEIFSIKGDILSKIMNLIYLLDYASIYHALNLGIDPAPVNSIDFVKSKLIS